MGYYNNILMFNPEPRGPRVLPVGELVLWYGMFAPCGRLLGTTGFACGAPFNHGTIPLIRIASSGHTSSHLRQPKQTSSLTISIRPLLTLKQRTGQISTQAPQA